jgi:hypothetical protein
MRKDLTMLSFRLLIAIFLLATAVFGQTPARVEIPTVLVDPKDVASIDSIIKAFYESISGPAGQPRQWGRDKTLYIPGVKFVSMSEQHGKIAMRVRDHQQFVDSSNAGLVRDGFYETELGRIERRFGNTAHVLSSYEMRTKPDGPVLGRGVNSIHLVFDGNRWWITHAIWDDERPNNPIPADLLPPKKN